LHFVVVWRGVSTLIVLGASLLVAYFLSRGIAHSRPHSMRPLTLSTGGAIVAPLLITLLAAAAKDRPDDLLRFGAFAIAVVLLGYMFLAGAWLLWYLAEQMAPRR
jgi:membrane-bound metal-dependent hydrolase YbcI (DUF457 family)